MVKKKQKVKMYGHLWVAVSNGGRLSKEVSHWIREGRETAGARMIRRKRRHMYEGTVNILHCMDVKSGY